LGRHQRSRLLGAIAPIDHGATIFAMNGDRRADRVGTASVTIFFSTRSCFRNADCRSSYVQPEDDRPCTPSGIRRGRRYSLSDFRHLSHPVLLPLMTCVNRHLPTLRREFPSFKTPTLPRHLRLHRRAHRFPFTGHSLEASTGEPRPGTLPRRPVAPAPNPSL